MKQYIQSWRRFFDYRIYLNLVRPLITKDRAHSVKIRDSTYVGGYFYLKCVYSNLIGI